MQQKESKIFREKTTENVTKITKDKKSKVKKEKDKKEESMVEEVQEEEEEEEEEENEEVEDEENSISIHSEADHIVRSCHRLPDVSCLDAERTLQRIATTGGRKNETIFHYINTFIHIPGYPSLHPSLLRPSLYPSLPPSFGFLPSIPPSLPSSLPLSSYSTLQCGQSATEGY